MEKKKKTPAVQQFPPVPQMTHVEPKGKDAAKEDRKNQCQSCAYWREIPEHAKGMLLMVPGQPMGECKRWPPVIAGASIGFQLQPSGKVGHFPITDGFNFCGEYKEISS